jgi:hypothetical protein
LESDQDYGSSIDDGSSSMGTSIGSTTATPMTKEQMQRSRVIAAQIGSTYTSTASSDLNMTILAHVTLAEGKKYPYEVIFKSVMMDLMDAVTNEYVFVR